MNSNEQTQRGTHLMRLRGLMPDRTLTFDEALHLAELQANRLLQLSDVLEAATPSEIVSEQPRVRVEHLLLPASGRSHWESGLWHIQLNAAEPRLRQRFTLMHEFKHVLDAGNTERLYARLGPSSSLVEQVCDYFAACLLMPKRLVKRLYGEGIQDLDRLARTFDVSTQAMRIRLQTLGLEARPPRCAYVTARRSDSRRRATSRQFTPQPAYTSGGRI